ncbi:hypothetical protein GLOTRDRAFT_140738 [Gloeophyllum trabeum ATCC 11539]|uniref:HMG box domain-containing protein n=1 Tax=Gloeophyllum trabeum (strain ATCC 11539 / FP-39264 / Madison 617) TaxID=670483 RepID=S7RGN1_GLOTA|nr:uncharacterized protein GLOTRDRAFT_140738 [Gloeophyllum trabeum ATCC 11539]EPQ51724.1 hypothetical protein GLOTRDRAFT_140738 [Gloeophyllum trabeum ATCC 11539]
MPAERTKKSRRHEGDGVQLTWTTPVEPSGPQAIAFAPNLTPCTFNEPPPLEDPPESTLFPAPDCAASRRATHTKKKPDNHIPRPPNAFILFRSAFIKSQHVSSDVETNHSTLSKIIGLTWQNLPHEERQVWHAKAKAALDEHKRKWPEYAFRPLHTKAKGPTEKRKVREVGPKDIKRCEKIAELLVQGKKGEELDRAIREFDQHHVPQIITRFEAPLTARAYRRSSSAPAPDTDHSKQSDFLVPSSPDCKPRALRACSTQPTRNPSPTPGYYDSDAPSPLGSDAYSEADTYYDGYQHAPSTGFTFTSSTEPSFNFAPFTWTETVAAPDPSCDPLVEAPGFENLIPFSPQPSHVLPCPAQYDQGSLTIDTSFVNSWSSVPSPVSSVPGTPHCYSATQSSPCEPTSPVDTLSPLGAYDCTSYAIPYPVHAAMPSFDNLQMQQQQYYDVPSEFSNAPQANGAPYFPHGYTQLPKEHYIPQDQKSVLMRSNMDMLAYAVPAY